MTSKPKVAFVCVHNACRSQIAEALGKLLAGDIFESFSAGTETRPQINQDAVRMMKRMYGIDMEKNAAQQASFRVTRGGRCRYHGMQRTVPVPALSLA